MSNNVGQASGLSQSKRKQTGSLSCMMAGLATVLSLTACAPQQKPPAPLQDKPLASFQTNLFQKAFDIASAIPTDPHIKSRSGSQRSVVSALIETGCPVWAAELAGKIENWHRGGVYADLAFFYAENGAEADARAFLQQAEQVASSITTWHRDRIFSRMGQAFELLGDTQSSARITGGIEKYEAAKIHQARAAQIADGQFEPQFDTLNQMAEGTDFDLKGQGLLGVIALYDRFYDEVPRRDEMAAALKSSSEELAPIMKIDLFLEMADVAVSHGDQPSALEWVHLSKELFDGAAWLARFGVPVAARIAERAFLAGDAALAKQMLESAEATYRENESEIINIFRADTLIPVAEAVAVTGDVAHALTLYMQAAETAVVNPNSRPQAEDLSAVYASMALHGIEPDDALWSRIKELQANLGDPW